MSLDRAWERATPRERMTLDLRLRELREVWDEARWRQRNPGLAFVPTVTKADLVDLLDALILRTER